jgi:hypothetical protein
MFFNFPAFADWHGAKSIEIPGSYVPAGGLTNVPVMVRFSADKDIGALCRADGYDVRFCDDSGTELAQYRLSFSVSGGAATGEFWVKLPSITQAGTTIYCVYGNASAANVSNSAVNPDILTDGDFEQWTSPTNLTNWTAYISGSSTINRESTVKTRGNYAVRFDVDANTSSCYISQNLISKYRAGEKYIINFNSKSSVSGKSYYYQLRAIVGATIYFYDFSNNIWTTNATQVVTMASLSWTLFSQKMLQDPPVGSTEINYMIIRGLSASSSLYFDDAHSFAGDSEDACDFISASWYEQFMPVIMKPDAVVVRGASRPADGSTKYSGWPTAAKVAIDADPQPVPFTAHVRKYSAPSQDTDPASESVPPKTPSSTKVLE